jgi:3-phenylpropionate/cinnamic acid dioxygenase small subunit
MPRRLVRLVAHPEDEQTYENGRNEMKDRLEFITTNRKIFNQCLDALDGGDEWVYVQRMEYGRCKSRIIGRVKVAQVDESAMRVRFENWETYDAAPSRAFGGSTFAEFPD